MFRCPGQDTRKLKVSVLPCPQCGYIVEVFSDELTRPCPQCHTEVAREKLPSCLDWCAAARDCLGEERWQRLLGKKKTGSGPDAK